MGLEERILEAWNRLSPKILSDPDELAKRLARRRSATMLRPPRAWCLALRANDRRIHLPHAIIEPPYAAMRREAHEVTLTSALLRRLCRPAYIPRPGEEPVEIAQRLLGARGSAMHNARKAGLFRERFVQGLAGKRGNPVPLIYTEEPLDPGSMFRWQYPHPIWNTRVRYLVDHVPDGISQILRRVPTQKEIPHDRSNLYYAGWRWICPGCELPVRLILYPLVSFNTMILLEKEFPQDHPDALPDVPSGFACRRCHRVESSSMLDRNTWNYLIAQVSGGLLYGREVPRPDTVTAVRIRPYKPQVNRTAPRRAMVRELLLQGTSIRKIAQRMQTGIRAVLNHAREICKQENVKNRHDLSRKYGCQHRQPLNQNERAEKRRAAVLKLLLKGWSDARIRNSLRLDVSTINRDTHALYKQHQVHGREELAWKLGKAIQTRAETLREKIRELRAEGLTWKQVAARLRMNFHAVDFHAKVIRRKDTRLLESAYCPALTIACQRIPVSDCPTRNP